MAQLDDFLAKLKRKPESCTFVVDETGFFSEEILLEAKALFPERSLFHAPHFDWNEIHQTLMTRSLFSSKKLFVFKNADQIDHQKAEWFIQYLHKGFRDLSFFFISEKKTKGKLYLACSEKGTAIQFKRPYESQMSYWIQWLSKKEKKTIETKAIPLLLGKVGTDLLQLKKEIEKLSLYVGEKKEITAADVKELLYSTRQHSIFELTDAIGYRKKERALALLEQLLNEGEAELFIFSMLMRHLRNLWKAVHLKETASDSEAQTHLGMHPMFWDDFRRQRDHFEKAPFESYWAAAAETDKTLKSLSIDKRALLSRFVMAIC